MPGPSPAGAPAGWGAGLAGMSGGKSGAQSPFWVPAGWCQPLSQAAVGGHGRQMAWCPGWCRRVHGPGLTGLTFTGLGPQGAVRVCYLPLQSRQGLGRSREGTRASLSLSPCLLLRPSAAPSLGSPCVSHALRVAKDAHREVLDVRWPLCRQLEKLHIVPLHPIYGD